MSRLTLGVGRIVVELGRVETERQRELHEELPERLREAFQILAERLRGTPFARLAAIEDSSLDALEIGPETADELLGERGSERLADELYARLVGSS